VTCTTKDDSRCLSCPVGRYLSSGQCNRCTPIDGCDPEQTKCTTALDSECLSCNAGRYLVAASKPHACATCTALSAMPNCARAEPCDQPGMNHDSHCLACADGYRPSTTSVHECVLCSQVENCQATVSCPFNEASQMYLSTCAACFPGYYLSVESGKPDVCAPCTDPTPSCGSLGITCTSGDPGSSRCGNCTAGHLLVSGTCVPCTAVANCNSPASISCTSLQNSRCKQCQTNYYLDNTGLSSVCRPCAESVPHCKAYQPNSCQGTQNSICTECIDGYYLDGSVCIGCPVISACDALTCSGPESSTCTACHEGYYGGQVRGGAGRGARASARAR
jgi:hypothetical protein